MAATSIGWFTYSSRDRRRWPAWAARAPLVGPPDDLLVLAVQVVRYPKELRNGHSRLVLSLGEPRAYQV